MGDVQVSGFLSESTCGRSIEARVEELRAGICCFVVCH